MQDNRRVRPKKNRSAGPVDEFMRTPLRRYKSPPEPKPAHVRRRVPMDPVPETANRFKKHYYDLPDLGGRSGTMRLMKLVLCGMLILWGCRGSAPLSEVPDANARFMDWAARENERIVQTLPGPTPEPGTELYAAVNGADPEDEQERIEAAQLAQRATPAPAGQETLKHYEPGELAYHTDRMDVTIEQKTKNGMTYFVCDIRVSDVSQLRTAFAGDDFRSGIYEATSSIAGRYSPVLAINADFCRYHRDGVIIRNGELLRKQNIQKHHLLVVDAQGNLSAQTDRSGKQGLVAERLAKENVWQTFEFGPVLVENGQAAELPKKFYVNCNDGYFEPRTAIGQIGPLHYIVIVVDGRRTGYSTGASIPQLQQLFLDEGAQFAFNLDGGGSTSLYFLGQVINMPSGGKERSVSDVILFMPNPM